MFLEPFLAALLGGVLGGLATGTTVVLILRSKGQKWFIDPQVDYLEKKLKEVVVEQAFGQITKVLDRGERLGQLVTRVLEIVQLLRGGRLEAPQVAQGAADVQLAAAHAAMGAALSRLGRGADAQREFEQAVRLDANNQAAQRGLRELAAESAANRGHADASSVANPAPQTPQQP